MKELQEFNQFFKEYSITSLKKRLGGVKDIFEICSYVFEVGGKFFRPFLLYKVAEYIDYSRRDKVLPFCLALELIHNYSLIHDDLPCMDNADFRRGVPTVHKKFGEAEAVLAGDMLLTLAFDFVSDCKDFEPQRILRAIKKMSQYSSYRYLITGQFFDIWIQKNRMERNEQSIKITNMYKTSGLILLAVEIPIILFQPIYSIAYKLVRYGYLLGLLFQATDDFMDNDGLAMVLGKEELRDLIDKLYNRISKIELNESLKDIARFVYDRVL